MKYRVVLTSRAHIEAAEAALWWAEHRSPEQAARWYQELHEVLERLSENPERHSYAKENDSFTVTLRQVLFGVGRKRTHRIVFHLKEDIATVVSIRHLAQSDIVADDL